jgi:hypothetical protein
MESIFTVLVARFIFLEVAAESVIDIAIFYLSSPPLAIIVIILIHSTDILYYIYNLLIDCQFYCLFD